MFANPQIQIIFLRQALCKNWNSKIVHTKQEVAAEANKQV